MNRGLKHYTKQLTQEVGGASCSVNLNKEDANLHISIPLIKTVGLDPIDLSLIFNLQDFNNDSNNYLFGKGSKLNLFTRYTDTTSKITLLNADGSSDEYLSTKNFYNAETQLTINKVQYTSSQYIYQVKDKYGNQRDFYNGINYPKQIKMKSGAVITTDFQTTQPYIYNGKGDKIQFTVNSSGFTTKLTYLHNDVEVYRTEIEYSNERISRVKYYNSETLISSLRLIYGGYYFELIDEISGYRIKYIYSGSRVLHIIPGYESSYVNSPSSSITYEDNKTTVTNYKGEKFYYYFDSYQLPLFEMDDKGNVIETEYDPVNKMLLSKNNPINVKDYSLNMLPSSNVNIFTPETVTVSAITVDDSIFKTILGNTIYKVTGTTDGVNRLSYRLNISGIATDSISAVIFGKQLTNFSNSNYVRVSLRAGSYTDDVDYFKKKVIDGQFDLIILGVSPEKSYDFIDLDFIVYGKTSIELGGIQVIKKDFGTFYQYDEALNLIELCSKGPETSILYNNSNLISTCISNDSSVVKFEYDEKGNLLKYSSSYGTKIENTYDISNPTNKTSTVLSNLEETKIVKTNKVYSDDGRFIFKEIDELGNETTYNLIDSFGRILKVTNALGNIMEYNYYENGLLKDILMRDSAAQAKATYFYDSNQRLTSVMLENGSVYEFEYDEYNNLTLVKLNDVIILKYTYNLINGAILTQKNGENGDGYRFDYDGNDNQKINAIYYINKDGIEQEKYTFEYDTQKRLKKVYDYYGDCLKEFVYDNDGRIIKVTGDYIDIDNNYDNLGNIVVKRKRINGKNVYTSYDSVSRSKGSHPESLLKGVSGFVGSFDVDSNIRNGENIIYSVNHNDSNVQLPIYKEGIINCVNVNSSNLLSYKLENKITPLECGCVQFWFKPNISEVGPDYMECLFSVKDDDGTASIELTAEGGRISLIVVDDSGNQHHLIDADYSINYNEWNFLSLNFINRNDGDNYEDITEYRVIINNHCQKYFQSNPGLRLSLGTNPVYNIGHKYDGNSSSCFFDGKIAGLRIMPRDYVSISEMYNYYHLSKTYIIENQLEDEETSAVDFSQSNLFTTDSNIYNQFEICPLQNNVKSLEGLKPIKFNLRRVSSYDKDRTFNFNNKIKRYAYVADGTELVYNFGQSTDGTIAMRVYFDGLTDLQYIFQGKDEAGHTIGLFRDSRGEVCIEVDGQDITTDFVINSNEWTTVALSFNETIVSDSETETNDLNLRIVVNNESYSVSVDKNFSYGALDISIGRMIDEQTETTSFGVLYNCYPLFGQIEMVCASLTYCELSTIFTLFEEIKGYTKVHQYDELGFLKKSNLHKVGISILSHDYVYKTRTDSRYLSRLINNEIIKTNGNILTNRTYTYDSLGRVTNISDNIFGNHNYQYDYRGFLKNADGVEYSYDKNGNLRFIGSKELKYENQIKDQVSSVDNKIVEYDDNNPTMIKSFDGMSFTFEGHLLTRIENENGTYLYLYDENGLRIKKYKTTGEEWKYTYDADKLVTEIIGEDRIDYLYDEMGGLYGFIVNSVDKYFYIRDILQNILGIINSNGQIVVSYIYDALGTCVSIGGTLANTIGLLNPFRYKGYYYDKETQLYWVSSRYYSPELCRWISPDSIEYLDPESINGLNLYAYCGNDPINKYDPTGHSAILIALAIGAVLGGIYGGISAAENGQNVLAGIAIGAVVGGVTGLITEVASVPLMLLGTFAVGAGGDIASQMILDGKSLGEVNLISAAWAGVANAGLALVGKGLSVVDAMNNLQGASKIIFGTMTNSPLIGLGMAINMGISKHASVYTFNDLYNDTIGKHKQLTWRW